MTRLKETLPDAFCIGFWQKITAVRRVPIFLTTIMLKINLSPFLKVELI